MSEYDENSTIYSRALQRGRETAKARRSVMDSEIRKTISLFVLEMKAAGVRITVRNHLQSFCLYLGDPDRKGAEQGRRIARIDPYHTSWPYGFPCSLERLALVPDTGKTSYQKVYPLCSRVELEAAMASMLEDEAVVTLLETRSQFWGSVDTPEREQSREEARELRLQLGWMLEGTKMARLVADMELAGRVLDIVARQIQNLETTADEAVPVLRPIAAAAIYLDQSANIAIDQTRIIRELTPRDLVNRFLSLPFHERIDLMRRMGHDCTDLTRENESYAAFIRAMSEQGRASELDAEVDRCRAARAR